MTLLQQFVKGYWPVFKHDLCFSQWLNVNRHSLLCSDQWWCRFWYTWWMAWILIRQSTLSGAKFDHVCSNMAFSRFDPLFRICIHDLTSVTIFLSSVNWNVFIFSLSSYKLQSKLIRIIINRGQWASGGLADPQGGVRKIRTSYWMPAPISLPNCLDILFRYLEIVTTITRTRPKWKMVEPLLQRSAVFTIIV